MRKIETKSDTRKIFSVQCANSVFQLEVLQSQHRYFDDRRDPFYEVRLLIENDVQFIGLEFALDRIRTQLPLNRSKMEREFQWLLKFPSLLTKVHPFALGSKFAATAPFSVTLSYLDKWAAQSKVYSISPRFFGIFHQYKKLVEFGLADQGENIPLNHLLDYLKVDDLQVMLKQLFGSKSPTARKSDLIEALITELSCLKLFQERIERKKKRLDWFFLIKPSAFSLSVAEMVHAKEYLSYLR
jgi:hypothetical protein